jgi:type IX secretion system PorP/SprF family membrane protein
MKKIFILISILWASYAQAQDEAVFNQYTITPSLVNPGATGFDEAMKVSLHFRNQWTGFTGAPRNIAMNLNGPIGDKLGLGVMLNSESAAAGSRLRGQINYGFRFKINEFKMGIGLSTQLQRVSLSDKILVDPKYQAGDPLAERAIDGENYFDASAGFYGSYNDRFLVGFSALNLIQQRLGAVANPKNKDKGLNYYTFMLGYKYKTELYTLTPSMMLRSAKDAPFMVDVNLMGNFLEDRLVVGASYRAGTGGVVGFTGGTKINNIQIAYTFDFGFSGLQKYSGGTHEMTLAYTFGKGFFSKDEKYKN